jgi:signal transduction histidine kinase
LGIPYSLNKIGQLHLLNKDFEKAYSYFEKAYQMRLHRDDAFGVMENKTFFGDLYSEWAKYDTAILWYQESNADAQQQNYPFLMEYNWGRMSYCYEKLGQFNQALQAYRKSVEIKDQLLNDKNSRTILELEERYRSAEKDRNISRLETEAAKKRSQVYIALALSIIIILIVIAYSINSQRKARAAKDAAIIEEREAGLKAVFDATEEERKRIAKDLHDGLGQQLSGLRLSWESVENQIKTVSPAQANRIHELTVVLDEACTEVRTISHTMMPKALQEKGLLAAVEDMLYKSLRHTAIQYDLQHFRLENKRFQERVELSMYRICQELINNVIKHSKATQVNIQLLLNRQSLVMIVEDNGIGIPESQEADGIGLRNIHSRVHTIGGEAMFEAGPEQGLVVTVRVAVE